MKCRFCSKKLKNKQKQYCSANCKSKFYYRKNKYVNALKVLDEFIDKYRFSYEGFVRYINDNVKKLG